MIRIPKDAERFFECSRHSKLGLTLISPELRAAHEFQRDIRLSKSDVEFCDFHTLEFKRGLKQISHVVTVQTTQPLESTVDYPCPIAYFEIKTLNIGDKELKNFGIGLAGVDYPIQRVVGSEGSIGLRGDGKIFVDGLEKQNLNIAHVQNGSGLAFNLR